MAERKEQLNGLFQNFFFYSCNLKYEFLLEASVRKLLFLYAFTYFCAPFADVAKLADAPDLGSGAARHVGSIPIIRTTSYNKNISQ